MALNRRRVLDPRAFGTGGVAGIVLGLALIGIGGRTYTTVGVIAIIVGAISLLLAVGSYLDDPGHAVEE